MWLQSSSSNSRTPNRSSSPHPLARLKPQRHAVHRRHPDVGRLPLVLQPPSASGVTAVANATSSDALGRTESCGRLPGLLRQSYSVVAVSA